MNRAPERASYTFGPVTVDVESHLPDASPFLRECLMPAVACGPFGSGELVIRATLSQTLVEHAERRAATALPLPCFALERRVVMLPGWQEDGATVVFDGSRGCVYRIDARQIEVIGRPGEPHVATGLMRIIREVLTVRRLAREALVDLHAAAFEVDGRAVLIAGPKYAGKTTLLCYAASAGQARILANDRVFVEAGRRPASVFGVPTLVSVRPATLQWFPQLGRGPRSPILTSAAALTLSQLAMRLGAPLAASAPLAAVVFPEIDDQADGWTLDTVTAAEGAHRLAACQFGAGVVAPEPTVFGMRYNASATIDCNAIHGVPPGLRFVRCRLGKHAYDRDAAEWLQAIISAAAPRS